MAVAVAVAATVMLAAACTGTEGATADADFAAAPWEVQPGVSVLTVTGAEPSEPLTLYDDEGTELLTVKADKFGQANFPFIPAEPMTVQAGPRTQVAGKGGLLEPGDYTLRDNSANPPIATKPFRIRDVGDVEEDSFYANQKLTGVSIGILGEVPEGVDLNDGFQYLTMRDGTQLSAMVRFPDTAVYGEGPWPTVIESSGYGVSNPDSEEPGARIARALGYATVSVNMRGTGCSGGVFDVFNEAQMADGYDMVEIVASQDWVLNNAVGTVGLSYSGITQLYTAATNPPHLAAITPQSVIVDPWLQQWPGGVYNAGFTRRWLEERDRQAAPNGQNWAAKRVDEGDEVCESHQQLRNMNLDFESFGKSLEMRPEAAQSRDLRELAARIEAPTYLTGAFQDEQTGAQFSTLMTKFDNAAAFKGAMWNGRHPDGYAPNNLVRWFEFLEFYVAKRVPKMNALVRAGLPTEIAKNFDLTDTVIEPDRFVEKYGDDYEAALAAYEAEDPIRVQFDSGAGANEVGEPGGLFTRTFTEWPSADSKVTTLNLGADGQLVTGDAPADPVATEFSFDATAGDKSFYKKDGKTGLLDRLWEFDWTRFEAGDAATFETAPLAEPLLLAGPSEANLNLKVHGATDADLQVTLSEIRPDGIEYLIQSGWLRMGHRKVSGNEDSLEPDRSFLEADYEEVKPDEEFNARISIPGVGAPIRAGSKLRMTVSTPGRDRAEWTFENPDFATGSDEVSYTILSSASAPSMLKLTTIEPGDIPATVAPCPALRGQACRTAEG